MDKQSSAKSTARTSWTPRIILQKEGCSWLQELGTLRFRPRPTLTQAMLALEPPPRVGPARLEPPDFTPGTVAPPTTTDLRATHPTAVYLRWGAAIVAATHLTAIRPAAVRPTATLPTATLPMVTPPAAIRPVTTLPTRRPPTAPRTAETPTGLTARLLRMAPPAAILPAATPPVSRENPCRHWDRWVRVEGPHRCVDCRSMMRAFILECPGCHLQFCGWCSQKRPELFVPPEPRPTLRHR